MDIQEAREAFERRQAKALNVPYEGLKAHFDENSRLFGARYNAGSINEKEWNLWLEAWQAKAQAVPEGFVLLPIKDAKFFSHDGDNYEVHDTLVEAKYEAECAIEHYRERLADQLSDPRSDGNFQDVGYGVVLAKSGYSIDHVVTQADIDKGDYSYEVGTEILSLFLIEAQEPAND